MNLQFLFLWLLGNTALSATLLGMKEQNQDRFFDYLAMASLVPIIAYTGWLAFNLKMWL